MQKILVVDDVEVNRELLREILEDDYIVEIAEDGEQAIGYLVEGHEDTAALLLDIQMPRMDGMAVIEEMKRRGWMPKIPVLIIRKRLSVFRQKSSGRNDRLTV